MQSIDSDNEDHSVSESGSDSSDSSDSDGSEALMIEESDDDEYPEDMPPDELEAKLMAKMAEKMCDPEFMGSGYLSSRDFKKNSPPEDFIKGDDKHYVFPFLFCDPRCSKGRKLPKRCEQNQDFVKSVALNRYIHKLCLDIIARYKAKANFVTSRGTTEDLNKKFKPIRNNVMDKKEDGKRQFIIIDLNEPENLEFKNFLANIKNLMIMTGSVPADCFPTSDGGRDQITLILQFRGAAQQHFHFDFNPALYKPHRNHRRSSRMRYKGFNGVSMFLNPSWEEQTLDLPEFEYSTGKKKHKQLYNTAMSLMLMNGNQAHAGCANDTDEEVWKFFWYIRSSNHEDEEETYLFYSPSCEYFPVAQAIKKRGAVVKLVDLTVK